MTKRHHIQGGYVRASAEEQSSKGWVGQFAAANGIYLFNRKRGGKRADFGEPAEEDSDPLNCSVIGHWLVGPKDRWKASRPEQYLCVSRCGVVAYYDPWYVREGKLPQTCYACRPNPGPTPECRTLPEDLTRRLQLYWEDNYMATAFEEKVDLKGEVVKEWAKYGRAMMAQVVDTAGYGVGFGWKIYVHNCAEKPNLKSTRHRVRVRNVNWTTRHIELMAQPAGCTWEFQFHLTTGRTDHTFQDIQAKIEHAVGVVGGTIKEAKEEPAQVAAAATQKVEDNGHAVEFVNLGALEKLGGNIARLIAVGKDLNDIAKEKLVATEKLRQAQEKKNAYHAEMLKADEDMKRAKVAFNLQQDKVTDLERKLKNEVAIRDQLSIEHTAKAAAFDSARVQFDPVSQELAAAEKELYDVERMEADAIRSVGDAEKVRKALAALAALS